MHYEWHHEKVPAFEYVAFHKTKPSQHSFRVPEHRGEVMENERVRIIFADNGRNLSYYEICGKSRTSF